MQFNFDGIANVGGSALLEVFVDAEDVDAVARHEGVAEGESVDGSSNRDLTLAAEDFKSSEREAQIDPCSTRTAAEQFGLEGDGFRNGYRRW